MLFTVLLVITLFTMVPPLFLLPLQKKYRWNGVYLFSAVKLPLIVGLSPMFVATYAVSQGIFGFYSELIHALIFVFLTLLFGLGLYFASKKVSKNEVFLYGITRKNSSNYLSKLILNIGIKNPKITRKNVAIFNQEYFDGSKPVFCIESETSSYQIEIQFGIFTRIRIYASKYKLIPENITSFKETCWKTFNELSDNQLRYPLVLCSISTLITLGILFWINPISMETVFRVFYLLIFPFIYIMIPMTTYRNEIDEFLPEQ